MSTIIDLILHLDQHVQAWAASMGPWLYVIMFLVIFAETGLVIFPFLPGDSLLFALGAVCALPESGINVLLLGALLIVAAVVGDNVNYLIGSKIGPKIFSRSDSMWLNKEHLVRAHQFYQKYGGRAIVLARFVPIVRTFVPFVAGIGQMDRKQFQVYNFVGGIIWIVLFLGAGYFFGQMPIIQRNFHIVIFAVIGISILPIFIEMIRARRTTL